MFTDTKVNSAPPESSFWSSIGRRGPGRSTVPSVLAIGDSWFFYPMPGGSLINGLRAAVAPRHHNIETVGENGAALREFVYGKYRTTVTQALESYGPHLSAVLVSGGGNDVAERADLMSMLHDDCGGMRKAADCFRPGSAPGTLGAVFQRLTDHYNVLIDRIRNATHPDVRVVLHEYDNALPTGKSVFVGMPAWFKPVFDLARVPVHLQAACIVHLLDHFTAALERIVAQHSGAVVLVHSRGTLAASEWANELHPTAAGFRKLATHAWQPVLRSIGLA